MDRRRLLQSAAAATCAIAGCSSLGRQREPTESCPTPDRFNEHPHRRTEAIAAALSRGSVCYITKGTFGEIDPSGTERPVQDAIDALHTPELQAGVVLLPPGITHDTGPINGLAFKSVIGCGAVDIDEERSEAPIGSAIEITGDNVGIRCNETWDIAYSHLHNFTLYGGLDGNPHPAMEFAGGGSSGGRSMNIGIMGFQNWQSGDGVIAWTGANNAFSSHWQYLNFHNCHGPALHFKEHDPLALKIDHIGRVGLAQGEYAIKCTNGNTPKLRVDTINTGGQPAGMFDGAIYHNGDVHLGFINYEPNVDPNYDTGLPVIRKSGQGSFRLDCLVINDFSVDDTLRVDSGVELGSGCERSMIGFIRTKGNPQLTNGKVNVTGAGPGLGAPNYYWGTSDDVTNSAGSNTNSVIPLGDLTSTIGIC